MQNICKGKIAIFITATGNYMQFVNKLVTSAEKYFLPQHKKTYFIFSDKQTGMVGSAEIISVPVQRSEWPNSTMNRCKFYSDYMTYQKEWLMTDYSHFFAIDADAYFAGTVEDKILSNLIGVEHCAYINRPGEFETNKKSECYIDNSKKDQKYYGGGFYGGNYNFFLGMNLSMDVYLDVDRSSGITPKWHDESALNKFFSLHTPHTILSPSYHWPEYGEDGKLNPYIKRLWDEEAQYIREFYGYKPPFKPKLIIVDKFKGDPEAVNKLRSVNNF